MPVLFARIIQIALGEFLVAAGAAELAHRVQRAMHRIEIIRHRCRKGIAV